MSKKNHQSVIKYLDKIKMKFAVSKNKKRRKEEEEENLMMTAPRVLESVELKKHFGL